jgi:hypothetical protein
MQDANATTTGFFPLPSLSPIQNPVISTKAIHSVTPGWPILSRFCERVGCLFSFANSNPVISTGAIHSTTVNRAAEKPASPPMPPPRPDAFVFTRSS